MEKTSITGMILNTSPQGEYDKRVTILTKEYGKVTAFARGARKEHSALMGALNPFVYGKFDVYEGRNAFTLTGAQVINYFPYFATHLKEAFLGFYFLDFMSYHTHEYNDEYDNLKLLYCALLAISDEKHDIELCRAVFMWKYLVVNGIYPTEASYMDLKVSARYALNHLTECDIKSTFHFLLKDVEKAEFIGFVDNYFAMKHPHEFKSYEMYKEL